MARHSAIPAAPRQVDSVVLTVAGYRPDSHGVASNVGGPFGACLVGETCGQALRFMGVRCVLYWMLTGARAFSGEDLPETLTAVLTRAEKS
jgi:hypothetical protein